MKNPISIKIDKPCHEDWDKMTPNEQGRFCGACQKNVIDFSTMTDNEIIAFLSEHTGKLCGQLRGSQLNRVIVQTKLTGSNWKLNSAMTALMLIGGAGIANAQAPFPVPVPTNTPVVQKLRYPVCPKEDSPANQKVVEKNMINAQVVDTVSGEPMAYAKVQLAGTDNIVQADSAGYFSMEIPATSMSDTITLLITSPGYFRQQYTFASANMKSISKIEVGFYEIMMKGEMIIETPRKCGNDK